MSKIILQSYENSGTDIVVEFRKSGSCKIHRMLAGDMLRKPSIVESLSDVDLATLGKLFATKFGGHHG